MSKRYYWLKLNENFFEDDTIKWIEEQENGERYVLFYLKLCLKSIKDEGYLIRYVGEILIPYDVKALAKLTDTDQDTVAVALEVFEQIGLIEKRNTGEIYMKQIDEMIGSETASARRMRKVRAKDNKLDSQKMLAKGEHCADNVQKCYTDIEIEKEIDIEIDIEEELVVPKPAHLTKSIIKKVMDEWNKLGLNQLKAISEGSSRHGLLKTRINDYSLENVLQAIASIKHSPFLNGQNKNGWIVTFDWFIRPNNFLKVWEGNYTRDKKPIGSTDNKHKTKFHLEKSRGDRYSADELESLILKNQQKKIEKLEKKEDED